MGLQTVLSRVQTLWDDQAGTWLDKDYIQGFIAIHSEDVESKLEAMDLSYDTNVIVLSNVAAGTTDLSQYQAEGQPLEEMILPVTLEWRLVGQDDSRWVPVPRTDKVMDAVTTAGVIGSPSQIQGIASYEWRGGLIYITPSSVPVDIRVRDEELPALLDNDSATYIKGLTNVLAYGVAALIGYSRGGNASKYAALWDAKFDDALEVIIDRMVKSEQTITRRMGGRRSTYNGPQWRIPASGG